jgi:metal-sulfur cluster biosynthetic enzyme
MLTPQVVLSALGNIVDPCSRTTTQPMNIVELGLIDVAGIRVAGARVEVSLLLTDPMCVYFRDIAAWITAELHAIGASEVHVSTSEGLWTPSRIRVQPIAVKKRLTEQATTGGAEHA